VPLGGALPSGEFIFVTWDMRVTATGAEDGSLGPFFGMEAYDDQGVFGLLGSLGVDATSLDVLYQRQDDGVLVETDQQVMSDVWYNFAALFDFTVHQYTVYFEGQPLATTGFVDRGPGHANLDQFTDADISALAAQANSASQLIAGTAYFDNFRILDGHPKQTLAADGNNDGVVDSLDLQLWRGNFGVSVGIAGSRSAGIPSMARSLQKESPLPMDVMASADARSIAAASAGLSANSLLSIAQRIVQANDLAMGGRRYDRAMAFDAQLDAHSAISRINWLLESASDSAYSVRIAAPQDDQVGDGMSELDSLSSEFESRLQAAFDAALADLFG
jgi:hypothetical protein